MEHRRPLIAGNWKMYKTPDEAAETAQQLVERVTGVTGVDIMIAPTYAALVPVFKVIQNSPVALGAPGCDPDDPARNGDLVGLLHQGQEHEDLIAEMIVLVGRDEQATVLHERHVGRIERRLVLDGQGEDSLPCTHALAHIRYSTPEWNGERDCYPFCRRPGAQASNRSSSSSC